MRGGYEVGRRRIICCYLWMFQEEIDQAVHWKRCFKIIHNTYDIEINTSFCSSIWHDTFGTSNQRFFNSITSISLALSALFFVHSLSVWIVCLLFCNFTRELTSQQPIIKDWWCSATVLRSIQKRLRTHSLLFFWFFFVSQIILLLPFSFNVFIFVVMYEFAVNKYVVMIFFCCFLNKTKHKKKT